MNTVPMRWRKSSHSPANTGNCVELAALPTGRGVRDSKLGDTSPVLTVPTEQLTALLNTIKTGQLCS